MPAKSDITPLIQRAECGDQAGAAELAAVVYDRLRAIAQEQMARERPGHSLAATDLVHEAYVRLVGPAGEPVRWGGRTPFRLAAVEAMHRILVDHARRRGAVKRGGGRARLTLSGVVDLASDENAEEILAFDGAFLRLSEQMPEAAAVVRMRFYAGLSVEQTAETLGVSERTVNREWTYARAFLAREMSREDGRE